MKKCSLIWVFIFLCLNQIQAQGFIEEFSSSNKSSKQVLIVLTSPLPVRHLNEEIDYPHVDSLKKSTDLYKKLLSVAVDGPNACWVGLEGSWKDTLEFDDLVEIGLAPREFKDGTDTTFVRYPIRRLAIGGSPYVHFFGVDSPADSGTIIKINQRLDSLYILLNSGSFTPLKIKEFLKEVRGVSKKFSDTMGSFKRLNKIFQRLVGMPHKNIVVLLRPYQPNDVVAAYNRLKQKNFNLIILRQK